MPTVLSEVEAFVSKSESPVSFEDGSPIFSFLRERGYKHGSVTGVQSKLKDLDRLVETKPGSRLYVRPEMISITTAKQEIAEIVDGTVRSETDDVPASVIVQIKRAVKEVWERIGQGPWAKMVKTGWRIDRDEKGWSVHHVISVGSGKTGKGTPADGIPFPDIHSRFASKSGVIAFVGEDDLVHLLAEGDTRKQLQSLLDGDAVTIRDKYNTDLIHNLRETGYLKNLLTKRDSCGTISVGGTTNEPTSSGTDVSLGESDGRIGERLLDEEGQVLQIERDERESQFAEF